MRIGRLFRISSTGLPARLSILFNAVCRELVSARHARKQAKEVAVC